MSTEKAESVVWRIELFREDDGRFACEFTSADGKIGGMSNYSSTPVGALAELCATLLKLDEDDSHERRKASVGAAGGDTKMQLPSGHSALQPESHAEGQSLIAATLRLCYVDGPWAYFASLPLSEQYGDDWNDAPYEHNAEPPYSRDGHTIERVAWEGPFIEPRYEHINSPYTVEGINRGAIPWLRPDYGSRPPYACIEAGATLERFTEVVTAAGGVVYRRDVASGLGVRTGQTTKATPEFSGAGGEPARRPYFWCRECQLAVGVDEDGCCRMCGHDAEVVAPSPDRSEAARLEGERLLKMHEKETWGCQGRCHTCDVVRGLLAALGEPAQTPPSSEGNP